MKADLFLALGIMLTLSFGLLTAVYEGHVPTKMAMEKEILAKMHDTT